jgi:hypothetical protein
VEEAQGLARGRNSSIFRAVKSSVRGERKEKKKMREWEEEEEKRRGGKGERGRSKCQDSTYPLLKPTSLTVPSLWYPKEVGTTETMLSSSSSFKRRGLEYPPSSLASHSVAAAAVLWKPYHAAILLLLRGRMQIPTSARVTAAAATRRMDCLCVPGRESLEWSITESAGS